ncbi:hypothetical protein D9M70_597230 [compost metagenome]
MVFAVSMFGENSKFLAVLCSIFPAWLSYRYLESRFRVGEEVRNTTISIAFCFMAFGSFVVISSDFLLIHFFNEKIYDKVDYAVEKYL